MPDLFIGVLIAMLVGAIVLSVMLFCSFRKMEGFDLVQGKLANSDSSIADVIPYLKITNEWSTTDGA